MLMETAEHHHSSARIYQRVRQRLRAVILVLPAVLVSSSCEFFYLHYTDCQYYNGPRFDRAFLNQPVLNQTYVDQVRVSFDDDSHIDSYDYWFEFVGGLPAGITYYQNNQSIHFQGAATTLGTYSFVIAARVRYRINDRYYYAYSHDYCTYYATQNFDLTVNPE